MERYLIELFIPAVAQTFDVFIPKCCKVFEVRNLLCAAIKELAAGKLIPIADTLLCFEDGNPLDINMNLSEAGIKNGSRLMLI